FQVKESMQLARSMQPVYVCNFMLKVVLFAPILVFCYQTNGDLDCVSRWFYIPLAYMELAYFTTLTIVSIFIITCFIRIHPRMKRKVVSMMQRLR
ncbi:hypothetical protein PMAYCL1PPCAC_15407, partial [Pristionchus mayeri]